MIYKGILWIKKEINYVTYRNIGKRDLFLIKINYFFKKVLTLCKIFCIIISC
ncbi:hypothetical protein CNEO3_1620004 [Clostridium neonatale]|uniref:Uncharacterized protein n=1 Tax=Clostridium neonatale TaxID=137838 RepID=A0AA86JUD5_9CLOT|nr:hypothetical protein CNEO_40950 [Clostridium neonatale]CAI3538398.1 hypothetical protein CNEO4_1460004 [Clostridium neonatale]CAI3544052.1 hypothetical protein CNEO3_1820004 [Clostridium neonatale]CAI3554718.1 hypothetical protein CNEO4_1520001 [Clostridium neonatale]CAI3563376.1 hypothetical protein CNEO3_1350004 [Clostridium neonatale]